MADKHLYIISGPNGAGKTKGGHNIPTDIIHRRYYEGIRNLFEIYVPIVDFWKIVDNSEVPRQIVAEGGLSVSPRIYNNTIFNTIKDYVGKRV